MTKTRSPFLDEAVHLPADVDLIEAGVGSRVGGHHQPVVCHNPQAVGHGSSRGRKSDGHIIHGAVSPPSDSKCADRTGQQWRAARPWPTTACGFRAAAGDIGPSHE